jgi:hypothetical protein
VRRYGLQGGGTPKQPITETSTKRNPAMEKYISITPPMGNTPRFIIETPNQIWYVTDYDGAYPVYLSNDCPRREPHVFTDLAVAKDALKCFWAQRGGAKLRIYQLDDAGKRVEVKP